MSSETVSSSQSGSGSSAAVGRAAGGDDSSPVVRYTVARETKQGPKVPLLSFQLAVVSHVK